MFVLHLQYKNDTKNNEKIRNAENQRVMKNKFEIKKFCNRHLFSDVDPFEVIRVVSEKCVEIRAMNAECVKPAELLGVGGFCANFDNFSQKWNCTSNENNPIERIRLGKRGWGSGMFRMSDKPVRFYDYNF